MRSEADDNLPLIFEKLGYEQDFRLVDAKLALGYLTVAIAGFLYYLEKKFAFHETKLVIAGAILVYFIICGAMMFLSQNAQYKNNKYVGTLKGKKVSVFTLTDSAYSPIYNVKIVFDDKLDGAVEEAIPFTKFFDLFGFLNESEFKAHVVKLLEKKTE